MLVMINSAIITQKKKMKRGEKRIKIQHHVINFRLSILS